MDTDSNDVTLNDNEEKVSNKDDLNAGVSWLLDIASGAEPASDKNRIESIRVLLAYVELVDDE